jgi:phage repressor protein C with HTH and peptisase S24 domain
MYRSAVKQTVQLVPVIGGTKWTMNDVTDRLVSLRKAKKLKSKAAAAKAYGIGYEVYKKIESYRASDPRNLTAEHALSIAKFHKVSPGWLMFGEGSPGHMGGVRILGTIGAGQEINVFDDNESFETVSSDIAMPDARAFEVKGDSMLPLARDGDTIFVGPERRDVTTLIGSECAVALEDGRRFFKVIENGSRKGLFDLVSYNAETIRDVAVHSAGLFLAVRRNQRGRTRRRRT